MEAVFADNFKHCLEHLRLGNYRAATSDLYPISKKTAMLGNASDSEVEKFAKRISEVVVLMAEKVQQDSSSNEDYRHLLTDAYRILRNSCGASTKVQEQLGGSHGPQLMRSSCIIGDAVVKLFVGENRTQVLAVIIQFLYNLCVGMEKNQDLVWDCFRSRIGTWLSSHKGTGSDMDRERAIKIINVACSVVEVCLPRQWQRNDLFLEDGPNLVILLSVIQDATIFSFDFGKKVMAKVVQVPDLMRALYNDLSFRQKYFMCNCLKDVINEWRSVDEKGSEAPTIHSSLEFLAESVILSRPSLTAEMLSYRETEEAERHHVKMLEVLSLATCCAEYQQFLSNVTVSRDQPPQTLTEYAIGFLKDIHEEGKKSYNSLSMARSPEEVDVYHPAYLLRCDLVRLIGNLAYRNKAVQDLVREYDGKSGLPVILEQTVIDERNPYLSEWAKLALSNLVRQNEDSADFIHSLSQQGQMNATGILRGCGLVVEKEGDKVKIRAEGSQPSLQQLAEKEPNRR